MESALAPSRPKEAPAPPARTTAPKKPKPAAKPAEDAVKAEPKKIDWLAEARRDLGLEGIKRIVGRWGFQGKALLSVARVEAPVPRKLAAAWFDQPAFRTDRLPCIPADASDLVMASFDLDGSYRTFLNYVQGAGCNPGDAPVEDLFGFERGVKELLGLRLREDLLRHVGPYWAMVNVPDRTGRKHTVYLAAVDDAAAFETTADVLASRIDGALRAFEESERRKAPKGREIGTFGMKRLPAPDRGYRVDLPSFVFTGAGPAPLTLDSTKAKVLSLFLLIGRSSVVLASDLGAPATSWRRRRRRSETGNRRASSQPPSPAYPRT